MREAIDGDTVRFWWLLPDKGRLLGIDAPEMSAPEGRQARDYLTALLTPTIPTSIEVHGKDKYGRTLLILHDPQGRNLNQKMLEAKQARPYPGR